MNYAQRIHTALDKDAETVAVLAHLPIAKLDNKALLIEKQIGSAKKYQQNDAISLLKIWLDQVSNAKVLKSDLSIDDSEFLDVEMVLPELAAFDMIEKRQDILKQKLLQDEYTQTARK